MPRTGMKKPRSRGSFQVLSALFLHAAPILEKFSIFRRSLSSPPTINPLHHRPLGSRQCSRTGPSRPRKPDRETSSH